MPVTAKLSIAIVVGWILAAALAPILIGDANAIRLDATFDEPTFSAVLGRDDLGRDIGRRVLLGASVSCTVAFSVVAIAAAVAAATTSALMVAVAVWGSSRISWYWLLLWRPRLQQLAVCLVQSS